MSLWITYRPWNWWCESLCCSALTLTRENLHVGWNYFFMPGSGSLKKPLERNITEVLYTSVFWSTLSWFSSKHHISCDWAHACINRRDGTCLEQQGGRKCWLRSRSKRNVSSCLFSSRSPSRLVAAGQQVQTFRKHLKFQKRFGWVGPGAAASLSGLGGGWRQGFREAVESFCFHHAQNASQCLHGNKKHSALAAYSSRNPSLSVQPQLIFSDWACKSLVVFVCSQQVCGCKRGANRRGDKEWGRNVLWL